MRRVRPGTRALFRRWYVWAALAPFLLIGALVIAGLIEYKCRPPAELLISAPRGGWDWITVDRNERNRPVLFGYSDAPVRVSPIEHGIYKIGVRFRDGKVAWANLYHCDAGVRRHVELYILRARGSERVEFRHIAYDHQVLFDGTTSIGSTSGEHPFILGGF